MSHVWLIGLVGLNILLGFMVGTEHAKEQLPAKITASIIECGRLQSQKNPNSLYVRLRVDLHEGKHGTVLCLK